MFEWKVVSPPPSPIYFVHPPREKWRTPPSPAQKNKDHIFNPPLPKVEYLTIFFYLIIEVTKSKFYLYVIYLYFWFSKSKLYSSYLYINIFAEFTHINLPIILKMLLIYNITVIFGLNTPSTDFFWLLIRGGGI